MICGYAKRETGEDASLEAFGDFRLKLVEREAMRKGFATRHVPDNDGECVEVYSALPGPGRPGEAAAFAALARRLRACDLGALSFEVDTQKEAAALRSEGVYSPWSEGLVPLAASVEVRGEGFAHEPTEDDRRKIEMLRSDAGRGASGEGENS